MHFVKKEPSTEEERIIKEKERTLKVNRYLSARNKIFEKKRNGEYDEQLLSLTQSVLSKNPDISTFWNLRRKTIDILIENDAQEQKTTAEKLLNGEMALTLECLTNANPKSYGAWHHRGWTLKRLISTDNTPDFKQELRTCKKALDYDCRNFHCWDHRRIVSELAKCTNEEEIKFSLDRINQNFSNYSAWHYRSALLKPKHADSPQLSDSFLSEELDRVAQAFSCDPEDQSAFVYAQWLLSLGSRKAFLHPSGSEQALPLSLSFNGWQTTIVWTKAVTVEKCMRYLKNVQAELLQPRSSLCDKSKAAVVWTYSSETPLECRLRDSYEWCTVDECKSLVDKETLKIIFDCDKNRLPNPVAKILLEKLEELKQIPPISSWTLYTYVLCLLELNDHSKHEEITTILQELAYEKDSKRRELYEAALSGQMINNALRAEFEGNQLLDRIIDGKESCLSLQRRKLTSLSGIGYLAGFIKNLNVAENEMKNFDDLLLPNLEHLDIRENPIERIPPLPQLNSLKSLNIASTKVELIDDVLPGIHSLPRLEKFIFPETKIVRSARALCDSLDDSHKDLRLLNYWL